MFLWVESVLFLTQRGGVRAEYTDITYFNKTSYRHKGLGICEQDSSLIPDAATLVMLDDGDLGTMVMARQIIIATPAEVQ
jgi:hypothetical protein